MRVQTLPPPTPGAGISLMEQARRIAFLSDREALTAFHENAQLFARNGRRLRFVDYVDLLRREAWASGPSGQRVSDEVKGAACDLTIDKFSNLPVRDENHSRKGTDCREELKQAGPDARVYFKAFLNQMAKIRQERPGMSQLEEEAVGALTLQALVNHHFHLSVLESLRGANPSVSRYIWELNNGARLSLWLPKDLSGSKRRDWLEANVDDPDPLRPGEQARVQAIIDSRLRKARRVPFDDDGSDNAGGSSNSLVQTWAALYGISSRGMAEAVACEKAAEIEEQRPAIRELGAGRLREMILTIFDMLEAGELRAAEIAHRFGLSKASLSRFAGSRWKKRSQEWSECSIPDLWLNSSRTLSRLSGFVEAARDAGLWPRVEEVRRIAERKAARRCRRD